MLFQQFPEVYRIFIVSYGDQCKNSISIGFLWGRFMKAVGYIGNDDSIIFNTKYNHHFDIKL